MPKAGQGLGTKGIRKAIESPSLEPALKCLVWQKPCKAVISASMSVSIRLENFKKEDFVAGNSVPNKSGSGFFDEIHSTYRTMQEDVQTAKAEKVMKQKKQQKLRNSTLSIFGICASASCP